MKRIIVIILCAGLFISGFFIIKKVYCTQNAEPEIELFVIPKNEISKNYIDENEFIDYYLCTDDSIIVACINDNYNNLVKDCFNNLYQTFDYYVESSGKQNMLLTSTYDKIEFDSINYTAYIYLKDYYICSGDYILGCGLLNKINIYQSILNKSNKDVYSEIRFIYNGETLDIISGGFDYTLHDYEDYSIYPKDGAICYNNSKFTLVDNEYIKITVENVMQDNYYVFINTSYENKTDSYLEIDCDYTIINGYNTGLFFDVQLESNETKEYLQPIPSYIISFFGGVSLNTFTYSMSCYDGHDLGSNIIFSDTYSYKRNHDTFKFEKFDGTIYDSIKDLNHIKTVIDDDSITMTVVSDGYTDGEEYCIDLLIQNKTDVNLWMQSGNVISVNYEDIYGIFCADVRANSVSRATVRIDSSLLEEKNIIDIENVTLVLNLMNSDTSQDISYYIFDYKVGE